MLLRTNLVALAGIPDSTQLYLMLPVTGMVVISRTNSFVPAGGLAHASGGDELLPSQVKSAGSRPPAAPTLLVSANAEPVAAGKLVAGVADVLLLVVTLVTGVAAGAVVVPEVVTVVVPAALTVVVPAALTVVVPAALTVVPLPDPPPHAANAASKSDSDDKRAARVMFIKWLR